MQQYTSQVPNEVRNALEEEDDNDRKKINIWKLVSQEELSPDRKGFIIKTYSIIFVMLAVTSGISALVYTVKDIKMFAIENPWLYLICFIVVIFMMCYMPCMYKYYRRVPLNYIMLAVFTLAHSWLIAYVTSLY